MVAKLFTLACLGAASATAQVTGIDYQSLNKTLNGKVQVGRPYNGPCYTKYQDGTKAYDQGKCDTIEKELTNVETLISEFGSYVNPSFGSCLATGDKCTLSPAGHESLPKGTCYQGAVPPVYVDAHTAEDVQAALKFASKNSLPVTVKNTGHDYRGHSSGVDTLAIWTHHITPDLKLDNSFTPAGCSKPVASPTITYGAGHVFAQLYEFLSKSGRIMVGGTCSTVGAAGGYLSGGGYGILTPDHGLAVDNAVQIKAVLLNGTQVTANKCQNQDLFFALRGGGGGTYAVVTEVTSLTITDDKPVTAAVLAIAVKDPRAATEIFVEQTPGWFTDGWAGSLGVREGNTASFIGTTTAMTVDEAKKSLKPLDDYFKTIASDSNPYTVIYQSYQNYYAFQTGQISEDFAARGIGNTTAIASRLVPKANFASASSRKELVDALVQYPYGATLTPPVRFTQPSSDLPGGPGQAAVTPAWRNSYWHLVHETVYDPADPKITSAQGTANMFKSLSDSMTPVRSLTPNSGAYMNEGDTYEPDHTTSFWGADNYKRLQSIKKSVDPNNLLSCHHCVGAVSSAKRNSCYPKI